MRRWATADPAVECAPEHAERRRPRAERRHLHRRHASPARPQGRRANASHHDGRRQWTLGQYRRRRPGDRRRPWPVRRASRSCPIRTGKLTLFIADYYNGRVRAVGPDGIIRDVSDEDRQVFGAPTRVAFGVTQDRAWLYVTDSSSDQVALASRCRRRAARRADDWCRAPQPPSPPLPPGLQLRRIAADDRAHPAPTRDRCCLDAVVPAPVPRTRRRRRLLLLLQVALGALAAVAAQDRHRLRARLARAAAANPAAGRSTRHRRQPVRRCSSSSSLRASSLQIVHQFASAVGVRLQIDTGQRMVYDLRVPAARSPAVARAPASHHDQHGRRGLPRRRRRLLDREPRDERRVSARDLGHHAGRDVRRSW